MVGLSSLTVARITSNSMVITSDGQKHNLGLGLKFEGKGLKVIDYSRKDGRHWEFSEKAVELLRDYKLQYPEVMAAMSRGGDGTHSLLPSIPCPYPCIGMPKSSDIFRDGNADAQVKEAQNWLKAKGVRNLEPVSLFCDQLKKVCHHRCRPCSFCIEPLSVLRKL